MDSVSDLALTQKDFNKPYTFNCFGFTGRQRRPSQIAVDQKD